MWYKILSIFFFATCMCLNTRLYPAIYAGEISLPVQKLPSNGYLSFKCNGKTYQANADHARSYAVANTSKGFLHGANKNNMLLELEVNGMHKKGNYTAGISDSTKCAITIEHTIFTILQPDDYLNITITGTTLKNGMILMSGSFAGKLHDKKGSIILITEGKFFTYQL